MRKKCCKLFLFLIVTAFFVSIWTGGLVEKSYMARLNAEIFVSAGYREQNVGEEMLAVLKKAKNPGQMVGTYLLESKFGYKKPTYTLQTDDFPDLIKKWKKSKGWDAYIKTTESIWNDVKYFPIPEFPNQKGMGSSYVNSWMSERTYGGKRGHEGTDIMAEKNERGIYPIVSMTDGVVESKGWLEKGGYRIGIKSPSGVYFYYAHLASYANVEKGQQIKAGDVIGFMGDSGYGPEGTVGQFAVHLHLGIYIYPDQKETSINPYWVLRYIENRKVKCYTEI